MSGSMRGAVFMCVGEPRLLGFQRGGLSVRRAAVILAPWLAPAVMTAIARDERSGSRSGAAERAGQERALGPGTSYSGS